MAKKKQKKTHYVTVATPSLALTKANVTFKIERDGELVGRLLVSYGAVVWKPANKQMGFRAVWSKFDDAMRAYGTKTHGK
jgi:hypothetical protein